MPGRNWKVIGVFAFWGLIGLAANLVPNHLFPQNASRDFLAFPSSRILVLTSPSVFFAVSIFIAGILAEHFALLPPELEFSIVRVFAGIVIAALTYPLALAGMIAAALSIYGSVGGENPETEAHWRLILFDSGGEIAVVFGGVLTVCLIAVAFRIAMQRWPRGLWLGFLTIALGVPLLTALIGFSMGVPRPQLFVEPTVFRIPLLLVIGEPILAGLIGHWFFIAANATVEPGA